MWKSGITQRQRSVAESCRVVAMLRAEAQRLAWVSGTSFGLEVVPEVCSIKATSVGFASSIRDLGRT